MAEAVGDLELQSKQKHLLAMCETRWVETHDAIIVFRDFYQAVLSLLEDCTAGCRT